MYPACATDEYASIRFTFLCTMAAALPQIIDAVASRANTALQPVKCAPAKLKCRNESPGSFELPSSGANATRRIFAATANDATFEPVAMKPATGVGAPS